MGSTHSHPPQDEEAHERFYSTWYMPDNPSRSCCNKADCYPTEIRIIGPRIEARRREDEADPRTRYESAQRSEDKADDRRTRLIIALLCGAAIFGNAAWFVWMVSK